MNKTERSQFLRERFRAIRSNIQVGAALVASLASVKVANSADDKDAARRTRQLVSERAESMDYSIEDNDGIRATVSRLAFESETAPQHAHESSGILTRAERAQLARELTPIRAFRADVRALPLLLTA